MYWTKGRVLTLNDRDRLQSLVETETHRGPGHHSSRDTYPGNLRRSHPSKVLSLGHSPPRRLETVVPTTGAKRRSPTRGAVDVQSPPQESKLGSRRERLQGYLSQRNVHLLFSSCSHRSYLGRGPSVYLEETVGRWTDTGAGE